jgi:RES domain-containing protein
LTITAWRITKQRHVESAFSGEGARLYGGRWNSPGTPVVYVAQSQALAVLEVLVHLDSPALLEKYALIQVDFDDASITSLNRVVLPTNWRDDPAPAEAQAIGDDWAKKSRSVALRVPSSLVPAEFNFLLNPRHADFKNLKVHKAISYQLDPRLSGKAVTWQRFS